MATGLIMVTILQCIQMSNHYTVHLPETKIVCPVYFSKNKQQKNLEFHFLPIKLAKILNLPTYTGEPWVMQFWNKVMKKL